MTTVFITNIPAPYREKVHEIASEKLSGDYCVLYCAKIESNRKWNFSLGNYNKRFLKSRIIKFRGRNIYLDSNIRNILNEIKPEVIVIGGFSMPMIAAYLWALFNDKKVVSFSDANLHSESKLSFFHKGIRKIFYGVSQAFVGASKKTQDLFRTYGAKEEQLFQSHLCANNSLLFQYDKSFDNREYDIILCGQMIESKMFDFSLDVVRRIKEIRSDVSVKVLGSGPLKEHILNRLDSMAIKYDYPGFVSQEELPTHYSSSKVFFFPTRKEAWGVVANEACASGTPVISTPEAGAANELIVNDHNGFVLKPDVNEWADAALHLLTDADKWAEFSKNAKNAVKKYSYFNAAQGIVNASEFVRKKS
ncbi:hypothetical protein PA25_26130 [Pseudoalteromonas sp. A25]|uniref:glycosyltransferase family 4 protein n=1 Tax=Pseudoalteromonas sp. A25 TaxID=116092 RepID=UPI0012604B66|nr:glycosyltransferase family 4 protein [Pseudoalteromonas sp. A25]BBN82628.1 hypothetical protein PA25_26130 [Pseudoalteromonas sp. A25]